MPPLNVVPGAQVVREGRSAYIMTPAGKRKIKTFDGTRGTWRLTPLGKRYYAQNQPPPEMVVKLPAKFYTTKQDGSVL